RAKFIRSKDQTALAPSLVDNDSYPSGTCRAMSEQDIREVIRSFGDAARRAREAGFDAVQIHAAHGYLFSQFLSSAANRRKDAWGGALENRLRFHREVFHDIRAKVGEDYPVLIKVGVQDGVPGGLPFEEGKTAARSLALLGYDALEISSGLRGKGYQNSEFRTGINRVEDEAYFRHWCSEIKIQVKVPVMIVGGLRTYKLMEDIIRKNEADFISLSRPLIREPDIINRWKSGNHHRAGCISCNKCFDALLKGEKFHCVQKSKKA
ncbi:MAG: NADH:flavin oxidoreductase, partial [Pseudomonadota bacterium]